MRKKGETFIVEIVWCPTGYERFGLALKKKLGKLSQKSYGDIYEDIWVIEPEMNDVGKIIEFNIKKKDTRYADMIPRPEEGQMKIEFDQQKAVLEKLFLGELIGDFNKLKGFQLPMSRIAELGDILRVRFNLQLVAK
jgi:hypothetical protein